MIFLKEEQNLSVKEVLKGLMLLVFIWSFCIALSLSWNIYQAYEQSHARAEAMLLSNFDRDQAFWMWVAKHGGIYLRDNKQSSMDDSPNDSDSYTLLDPATFLKKVIQAYPENFDSSIRMIGRKPFNSDNMPTVLENKILESFYTGKKESFDKHSMKETLQLGYFKAMIAKKSCLICHQSRGFKEGDLIGMAGVYLNLQPFLDSAKKMMEILVATHALIWSFGYIMIVFYGRRMDYWIMKHLHLKDKLEQSHDELESRVKQRSMELLKLSQALENSPVIVMITDEKGLIEYVNPCFSEVTGYSADDVIGQNPSIMKSTETPKEVYKELWNTINRGHVWSGELCNLRKDGSEFWVFASIVAFTADSDEIISYISVENDITKQKQAEKNIIQAKERAEKANNAKSEFLASMSHELRTPLNAIIGFSQIAQLDQSINEQQKEYAKEIHTAGKHLLSLINDILDLSGVESGKLKLNLQAVEYQTLINECYKLIEPVAIEKNITLDFSDYECAYQVQADYLRLKQIVLNVLSNAVKYSSPSGMIQLECSNDQENNVVVNITDTGIGLSEENLKCLFEPFNRLGMENSNIEGTGIGLAITKKLIEMMHGEIQVQSVLGEGTTFSIILPKAVQKINQPVSSAKKEKIISAVKSEPLKKLNILYIEDNPANARLIEYIINLQEGWNFLHAETAEDGIERIKINNPDVILMDVNLPGMSGIEACQYIRSDVSLKHIPIIAVSADATTVNIKKGLAAGFSDYITKPINVNKLIQAINNFF